MELHAWLGPLCMHAVHLTSVSVIMSANLRCDINIHIFHFGYIFCHARAANKLFKSNNLGLGVHCMSLHVYMCECKKGKTFFKVHSHGGPN